MRRVSDEALRVVGSIEVEGRVARLTAGQLERGLYVEVDKVLRALGGKWNRKMGGHVFEGRTGRPSQRGGGAMWPPRQTRGARL